MKCSVTVFVFIIINRRHVLSAAGEYLRDGKHIGTNLLP